MFEWNRRRPTVRVNPPRAIPFPADPSNTGEALRSVFEVLRSIEFYTFALVSAISEAGVVVGEGEKESSRKRGRERRGSYRIEIDYAIDKFDNLIEKYLKKAEIVLSDLTKSGFDSLASTLFKSGVFLSASLNRNLRDLFEGTGGKLSDVARQLIDEIGISITETLMRFKLFVNPDIIGLYIKGAISWGLNRFPSRLYSFISSFKEWLGKYLESMAQSLSSLPLFIRLMSFGPFISRFIRPVIGFIQPILGRITNIIIKADGLIEKAGQIATAVARGAGIFTLFSAAGLAKILSFAVPFFVKVLFRSITFFTGIVRSITSWIWGFVSKIGSIVFGFAKSIIMFPLREISDLLKPIVEGIKNLTSKALRFMSLGFLAHVFTQIFLRLIGLPNTAKALADISRRFMTTSFIVIREILRRIDFSRIFGTIYDVIKETLIDIYNVSYDLFLELYGKISDKIPRIFESVKTYITDVFDFIVPHVLRVFDNLADRLILSFEAHLEPTLSKFFDRLLREAAYRIWEVLYEIGTRILHLISLNWLFRKIPGLERFEILPGTARFSERVELSKYAMRQFFGLEPMALSPQARAAQLEFESGMAALQAMHKFSTLNIREAKTFSLVTRDLLRESIKYKQMDKKVMEKTTRELRDAAREFREAALLFREGTETYRAASDQVKSSFSDLKNIQNQPVPFWLRKTVR